MDEKQEFKQWALVEIFGHQRIAGLVSEFAIGGETFIRVDVPESNGRQAVTKLYGKGAIYAITFVDEETGKALAPLMAPSPISEYSARMFLRIEQDKSNSRF